MNAYRQALIESITQGVHSFYPDRPAAVRLMPEEVRGVADWLQTKGWLDQHLQPAAARPDTGIRIAGVALIEVQDPPALKARFVFNDRN